MRKSSRFKIRNSLFLPSVIVHDPSDKKPQLQILLGVKSPQGDNKQILSINCSKERKVQDMIKICYNSFHQYPQWIKNPFSYRLSNIKHNKQQKKQSPIKISINQSGQLLRKSLKPKIKAQFHQKNYDLTKYQYYNTTPKNCITIFKSYTIPISSKYIQTLTTKNSQSKANRYKCKRLKSINAKFNRQMNFNENRNLSPWFIHNEESIINNQQIY